MYINILLCIKKVTESAQIFLILQTKFHNSVFKIKFVIISLIEEIAFTFFFNFKEKKMYKTKIIDKILEFLEFQFLLM